MTLKGLKIVNPGYDGPERRGPMIIEEPWMRVLTKYGLGGGIALFLVYQLSAGIQSDIALSVKATAEANTAITSHIESNARAFSNQDRLLNTLVNVTVQQCVNAATDRQQRDACFLAITQAPTRDPR